MVHFSVKGLIAPVFTPVDSEGQLNLSVIPRYAKHLKEHEVDGVLVGGTSGEAMCLNVKERKQLLEAWILAARPLGITVMAQVGGAPFADVIELAKHAEQSKTDGMLTLPELYFKPRTPKQLVDYLEQVSDAAPSVPLVYYHFPAMTGVDMNIPELYREAVSRIPNFKGFKADLNIAIQLEEVLAPDHKVFIANHLLAPSALMGHRSSIATVTNIFPSLVRSLVNLAKSETVPNGIMKKQAKLNTLVAAITHNGKSDFVPSMKTAMELSTGITVGPPRKPLSPLTAEQKAQIQISLDKITDENSVDKY